MLNQRSIQSFAIKQGKARIVPPVMISLFLSWIPIIAGNDYVTWGGLGSIEILSSWYAGVILGITTLAYFAIMYQKEWFGVSYKTKFGKYFKIFAFAFIGLAATLVPYYLDVGVFLFTGLNVMSGGENTQPIILMALWSLGISLLLADMFNSLDGKSGILFKMPPINKTSMKKYSVVDYKIKKFFNL